MECGFWGIISTSLLVPVSVSQHVWLGHMFRGPGVADENLKCSINLPLTTKPLKDLLHVLKRVMKHNFIPCILTMAGIVRNPRRYCTLHVYLHMASKHCSANCRLNTLIVLPDLEGWGETVICRHENSSWDRHTILEQFLILETQLQVQILAIRVKLINISLPLQILSLILLICRHSDGITLPVLFQILPCSSSLSKKWNREDYSRSDWSGATRSG